MWAGSARMTVRRMAGWAAPMAIPRIARDPTSVQKPELAANPIMLAPAGTSPIRTISGACPRSATRPRVIWVMKAVKNPAPTISPSWVSLSPNSSLRSPSRVMTEPSEPMHSPWAR